jgi:nicotinamide-nucleotide amidase
MSAQREIERLSARLAQALAGTQLRWSTAESCTGGQLAALMARDSALGSHLERGFIAYSMDAKCELLGVDRSDVTRCEAVNPEVAEAMAAGALAQSQADLSIALTGFCGPQQASEEVGLVYLACAARAGRRVVQECHFGDIGRGGVLDHAVAAALALMSEAVEAERTTPVLAAAQRRAWV